MWDLPKIRHELLLFKKKPQQAVLSRDFPELHAAILAITSHFPECVSFSHRLRLILAGDIEIPVCPLCGALTSWVQGREWSTYCSRVCSIRAKYGVDNYSQVPAFKEKRIKTNLSRYGVSNISQLRVTQDKIRQTSLNTFGVPHHLMAFQ